MPFIFKQEIKNTRLCLKSEIYYLTHCHFLLGFLGFAFLLKRYDGGKIKDWNITKCLKDFNVSPYTWYYMLFSPELWKDYCKTGDD